MITVQVICGSETITINPAANLNDYRTYNQTEVATLDIYSLWYTNWLTDKAVCPILTYKLFKDILCSQEYAFTSEIHI